MDDSNYQLYIHTIPWQASCNTKTPIKQKQTLNFVDATHVYVLPLFHHFQEFENFKFFFFKIY